jgi:hypothetical protein
MLVGMLAAVWLLGFNASNSCAEILVAQTRTSASVFGGATYTVDFNGATAGGQTFTFSTTEPDTRIVITFNAECACDGELFQLG